MEQGEQGEQGVGSILKAIQSELSALRTSQSHIQSELSALRTSQSHIQSELSALRTSQSHELSALRSSQHQLQSSLDGITATVKATQAFLKRSIRADQAINEKVSPGLWAPNPKDELHKLKENIFSGKSQRRIIEFHAFAKREDSTLGIFEVDKANFMSCLLPDEVATREQLLEMLKISPLSAEQANTRKEEWRKQSELILSLRSFKEDAVQTMLGDWINSEEAAAVDTHEKTLGGANMLGTRHDMTVESSGKPDIFCRVFSMWLEMKSRIQSKSDQWDDRAPVDLTNQEYLVLYQLFERVFYAARHNELLKRVVCFASTGHFSWCLLLEREIHNVDGVKITSTSDGTTGKFIREKYTLVRMHAEDIVPVWETLVSHVKNASDSSYFLHQDLFFPVAGILNQYDIHPAGCKLRLCGRSNTAHIIGIHVGCKKKKKNVKFALHDELAQLVVKVSKADKGLGVHEIKVLQHLHRSLSSEKDKEHDPTAYVIATYVPPHLSSAETAHPTHRKRNAATVEEEFRRAAEEAAGFTGIVCGYELFRTKDEVMPSCIPHDSELHHDPQILVEKNKDGSIFRQYRVEWYKPNVPESWRDDFCAILMFFGESPIKPQFKDDQGNFLDLLEKVLGKIHQANVLHTDMRPTNWRLFSSLPAHRGNLIPLLIDFDHAVFVHPSGDQHNVQTNEGARRDLMLKVLYRNKNSYPNGILPWSKKRDMRMIANMIEETYMTIEGLHEVRRNLLADDFTYNESHDALDLSE